MTIIADGNKDKQREKPNNGSFFPEQNIQGVGETGVQAQPQRRTAQQYLDEITTYTPAKPVYDPNRPEELKRLARSNAIAKGLSLVGDIVSTAKGGNVNVRRPDNMEAKYTNDMYNYLDDYSRRTDQWNYRDWQGKMSAARAGMAQANADRSFDAQEDYRDWQKERQAANDKRQQEYTDAQIENMNKDNERQERVADAQIANYRSLQSQRANKGDVPGIRVQTRDGQVHQLTPEQASLLRDEAIRNRESLIREYPQLFNKEEVLDERKRPTGEYKYSLSKSVTDEDLIRAYIQSMQEQSKGEDFNYLRYIEDLAGGRSKINVPYRDGQQPEAQPKKETTTFNYGDLNYE